MSRSQNEISVYGATRVAVGLSTVIRIIPNDYDYAQSIKIFSGAGTLEIVRPQLSGSSTGTGTAWGTGYPLGASEIFNVSGPAVFYLAATGATMVAAIALGKTSGASVL